MKSDHLTQYVLCRATTTKVGDKIKIGPKLFYIDHSETDIGIFEDSIYFGKIKDHFNGMFTLSGDYITTDIDNYYMGIGDKFYGEMMLIAEGLTVDMFSEYVLASSDTSERLLFSKTISSNFFGRKMRLSGMLNSSYLQQSFKMYLNGDKIGEWSFGTDASFFKKEFILTYPGLLKITVKGPSNVTGGNNVFRYGRLALIE